MKGMVFKGLIAVCGLAAIFGIKILNLPGIVTVVLVGGVLIGMLWVILPSR